MSNYSDQDPLLPKDERAPEISAGSRAPSIKNIQGGASIWNEYGKTEHDTIYETGFSVSRLFIAIRNMIVVTGSVFLLTAGISLLSGQISSPSDNGPLTLEERVDKILTETPLIDGHNDLAVGIRFLYNNHIYRKNFTTVFEEGGMFGHVDLPRLIEGKSGGAFWSVFAPCPSNGSDFSDSNYEFAVKFTYDQIDVIARLLAQYPDFFSPPPNSSTALPAFESGKFISPMGVEGLHQIGNSMANLRSFHSLGVRYSTLTHNCHNIYADAAIISSADGNSEKAKPYWGGVSRAGQDLIQEMNRLGMIVDLAHVSQDTMRDVLGAAPNGWAGSRAPIIFSHSSAYAVCPHPRNVPDHILELVRKTNSLVMINFSPDFVSCKPGNNSNGIPDFVPENSTLAHVVRHIRHVGDTIGYNHVGLGSDFDGIPSTPRGLDDVSKFPHLVAEMLEQGIKDSDAAKVVGGNLLRVWADVDKVALEMQAEGVLPIEDDVPPLKFAMMNLA